MQQPCFSNFSATYEQLNDMRALEVALGRWFSDNLHLFGGYNPIVNNKGRYYIASTHAKLFHSGLGRYLTESYKLITPTNLPGANPRTNYYSIKDLFKLIDLSFELDRLIREGNTEYTVIQSALSSIARESEFLSEDRKQRTIAHINEVMAGLYSEMSAEA